MNNINFVAIDETHQDIITFIPIIIETSLSKTDFLRYGNVLVIIIIIFLTLIFYTILSFNFNNLSGLLGIISASLLTLMLLILKENYQSMNKEKIYLEAFMNELERNMMVIYSNLGEIYKEKQKFDENNLNVFDIEPYYHIQFDIWNSLKQNMALDFLKIDIRNFDSFVFESYRFNEMIESRENTLKNPLIAVKPTEDAPLDAYTNIFLIKKMYNKMLLEQCEKVIQYLENTLKSRGNLIKLDSNSLNTYKSFDDAVKKNKIPIANSDKKKFETLYSDKSHTLIFYSYKI